MKDDATEKSRERMIWRLVAEGTWIHVAEEMIELNHWNHEFRCKELGLDPETGMSPADSACEDWHTLKYH